MLLVKLMEQISYPLLSLSYFIGKIKDLTQIVSMVSSSFIVLEFEMINNYLLMCHKCLSCAMHLMSRDSITLPRGRRKDVSCY